MSDIQVTRRDREMAEKSLGAQLEAHFGSAWPRGNDLPGWWRSVGQTVIKFMKGHSCFCSDAYEKTIAQARAEGFAAGKAAALEVLRVERANVLHGDNNVTWEVNDVLDVLDTIDIAIGEKEPGNV